MTVRLFRPGRLPPSCRRLRLFERACRLALGPAARRRGELSLVFTTNAESRVLNRRYLGHDYATDVIAFPFAGAAPSRERPPRRAARGRARPAPAAAGPGLFGEVYVSVDRARRQARGLGHPLLEELLTLAVHGVLHLRGYDDHSPAARKRMFARQEAVARRLLGY